jgi:hypothetical protein
MPRDHAMQPKKFGIPMPLVEPSRDHAREGDDQPTMITWITTNGTAPQ